MASEREEYEPGPATYQGKLYGEVGKEHTLCTLPLVLSGGDLVWLELPPAKVRDSVDNDPRDAASKVDNLWGLHVNRRNNGGYEAPTDLVEKETSKTRGDDGVTDQEVPVGPLPLDPAERGKVGASVELLCGILVEDGGGCGSRVKGHDRVGEGAGRGFGQQLAVFYSHHTFKKIGPLYSSHDCYASHQSLITLLLSH